MVEAAAGIRLYGELDRSRDLVNGASNIEASCRRVSGFWKAWDFRERLERSGLSEMADWLLSFAGGAGEVGMAIETPRGPVVENLMEHGFAVHSTRDMAIQTNAWESTRSSSAASANVSHRQAPRTTGATGGCWPRRCVPIHAVFEGWSRPTRPSSNCASGRG